MPGTTEPRRYLQSSDGFIGLSGAPNKRLDTNRSFCDLLPKYLSYIPLFVFLYKKAADRVGRGELIAEICSVFEEVMQQIFSPTDQDTVIVGLEANPVAKTGNGIVNRIFLLALISLTHPWQVHLGVIGEEFLERVCDGHL
ncbi:uncharacterized protein N7446_008861 [Penicillium canescens]|uniref:Uncharacterized protein n=1 Tax=Penicillium canescens TaxID=5083 RepID=A0AAD6IRE7_PENCN|nr:uncharacterized protein N7446_008861 [Penicillium canescens]KAJ6032845.1 hypothetical protein N7444_010616 [Penicillium canescens]KAJ6057963.1 hypothetical protein N7460_001237 [Penicillium canescens]KAJ6059278.1 hypothetical protein N7446_008861 [Penicillium canescens]